MMRRSLFFGLTLILVLAFAFLSIRGCRQEQKPAGQPMETVEKSEATATRVLKPQDLEIVHSKMILERNAGAAKPSVAARHEIEIFNHGNVYYKEIRLSFVYLSRTGKVLEARDHSVAQNIQPGTALNVTDIRMVGISESATNARVSIVYADVGSGPPAATPHN
jgi:hypothetical protein